LLYITQTQLMRESEHTVLERAKSADEIPRRICTQLLADEARYAQWHTRHELQMTEVANARHRERQVLKLRAVAIEQVHRTSLVRYLRDSHIIGTERDRTMRAFYGISDPRDSALAEHRTYLLAASTQLCTSDLLELVGDEQGQALVRNYELIYSQYFTMFCDRARALQGGRPYLLTALMPEIRDAAEQLRLRIIDRRLLPARPMSLLGAAAAKLMRSEPRPRIASARTSPQAIADTLRHELARPRPARSTGQDSAPSRPRDLGRFDRPR
jgi:hypothetical protein